MQVSGRLTMDMVGTAFHDAMQQLPGNEWIVDLAQVEAADSSAVSMLLGWVRNAQRNGASVTFANVPENLISLADLYGVADALPLKRK